MGSSSPRSPRALPGILGGLVITLPLLALIVVRWIDPLGDRGSLNVFTYVSLGLALLFWWLWWMGFSRQPWDKRLAVGLLPPLIIGCFFSVFRIERMSGEMIPTFAYRSEPPQDQTLDAPAPQGGQVDLATETENDFPRFLGPGGDQSLDHLRLDSNWDARPPERLWRRPVGAGWSGFAVRNGYAVTMEQRGEQEMTTCYRVSDGEPCWVWAGKGRFQSTIAGDGPRATPFIADGVVYSLGVYGRVAALDGADGQPIWQRDLNEELHLTDRQAQVFPYGRSNSPLVVDDLLIVPFGGHPDDGFVSLLAMDRRTGETVWQGGDRQVSCASPTVATLGGVRQVLSVDAGRAAGYDLNSGEVLWSHPWPGRTEADCNVSQPVAVPPDRVFLSKGYGQGAALLQLRPTSDGTFNVESLWHHSRLLRTKFTNVVIHQGHAYGLSDGILESVNLATGQRNWKNGRYRHGQILRVGEHLLVLGESGEMFLLNLSPDRPNDVLASFHALEGKSWNTFALYGDVLLVRNGVEAAAYRLPLAP